MVLNFPDAFHMMSSLRAVIAVRDCCSVAGLINSEVGQQYVSLSFVDVDSDYIR